MEKKYIIAIVLSLLVIVFYPKYLKKYYPQKTQQATAPIEESAQFPKTPSLADQSVETIAEAPAMVSLPKIVEKEIIVNAPLMEVVFSNYNATIKSIKLWDYLDNQGNPLELISPVPITERPLATNLSEQPLVYKGFREGYQIRYTAAVNGLNITKTFRIDPESYLIEIDMLLENRSLKTVAFSSGYQVTVGTVFPGDEYQANMYLTATQLIDGKPVRTKLGKTGFQRTFPGRIFWGAVTNKYFTVLLKPQTIGTSVNVTESPQEDKKRGITASITMPPLTLSGDQRHEEKFYLYAGPKKYEVLKVLGLDIDKVMDFGFLAPISKVTLRLLNFFYSIVHNYGLAIILLTILVRLILYPLTYKSYKSMREMQKIQPLMQELQKKYKEEPKRLQKEMMLLYKEHKVNPFGGCLPMILQMPILIALFTTLRSAIELRGAPFIFWIKDLSEPDTLFTLQNGFAINVLPILMIGTFFLQQKFFAMPAATPQQQQQQKMMALFMPVFMGFIFYRMPSGLVLYFTLSTMIGIIDQYRIKKATN